jgi:hypothetical protein
LFVQVQNANRGTIRRESQSDSSSNAATATGYDGDFAVQAEALRIGVLICQKDAAFLSREIFLPSLRSISSIIFTVVLAISKCVLRFAAQLPSSQV